MNGLSRGTARFLAKIHGNYESWASAAGRTPTRRENRLPHRENHHRLIGVILQTFSTAEDPRRHVGHVGESIKITHSLSDVRLNSACSAERAELFSSTNDDCPVGAWPVRVK